ncbi:MAG: ABC transporter ATP-binding protein [Alphaproteobacteria bacterium]|nr:ABC transporter ATP-binding protein [Alphaproteobacteria bacterium]
MAGRDGEPILEVRGLRTQFDTDAGTVTAVDGVSFSVAAGETVGIVGESGSGKSVTALSIMRLLDDNSRIGGGEVVFRGRDVLHLTPAGLRSLRGGEIAMVFQDPMTSLNPVRRIAGQLVETMAVHGKFDRKQARARAVELLGRMGVSAPERAIDSYPHEFSGGMRQRVMLAMGFANSPGLLIADEPTTALDVTIQAQILELLRELNADFGTAILLISHDLGVIANVCSRVIVMYGGEVVEEGPTEQLLSDPRHPYTWALINAVPRLDRHVAGEKRLLAIEGTPPNALDMPTGCRFAARCPFKVARCATHPALAEVVAGRQARCWVTQDGARLPGRGDVKAQAAPLAVDRAAGFSAGATDIADGAPILELAGLTKHFPLRRTSLFGTVRKVHAVDGVDLTVLKGETVGLVGESGCGKSTVARLITRIHAPTTGSIRFAGTEIATAEPSAIRPLRRRLQMIFQDPYASLNPRMTVGDILAEPLRFHAITNGEAETRARVEHLLGLVGLPAQARERYPHEFSGGQRQRIGTARALAVSPELIVADEPISSLDVNIQAQVINLFVDLQEQFKLTYVFIAHDLAVVRHVSDRIVVLYLGKIMEIAPAAALFDRPLHPYTVALLSAVPIPDVAVERSRRRLQLSGEPPSAVDPPSGCRFRTRCPIAKPICAETPPPLVEHAAGQFAACHFPGELRG